MYTHPRIPALCENLRTGKNRLPLRDASGGGFGELGEYGSRPSGIAFGFYVQLQYLGEQLNQQDATVINNAVKHANSTTNAAAVSGGMALLGGLTSAGMQTAVTRAATTGDTSWIAPQLMHTGQMGAGFAALGALSEAAGSTPIGTFMNQYNPALMFANSSYNVRIGSQVNHINEGYLWEANALAMIKAPLATLGGMMLAAGIASSETVIGAILIPIGAVITAAANSIQVNTTTGERAMKATDQAAISTGLTLVSSLDPGVGTLAGFAVNSGIEYDAAGTSHGWKAEGTRMGNAAVTSVMGSIGGAAGADIANTMLTVSEQYYRQKHGQTNTYDQLAAGPDLGRLGELLAIAMPAVAEGIAAKQANQRDQTNRAAGNLQALGAIGRRDSEGNAWLAEVAAEGDWRDSDFVKYLKARMDEAKAKAAELEKSIWDIPEENNGSRAHQPGRSEPAAQQPAYQTTSPGFVDLVPEIPSPPSSSPSFIAKALGLMRDVYERVDAGSIAARQWIAQQLRNAKPVDDFILKSPGAIPSKYLSNKAYTAASSMHYGSDSLIPMIGIDTVKSAAEIWKQTSETGPFGTVAGMVDMGVSLSQAGQTIRQGELPQLPKNIYDAVATLNDRNASPQEQAEARARISRYAGMGTALGATLLAGKIPGAIGRIAGASAEMEFLFERAVSEGAADLAIGKGGRRILNVGHTVEDAGKAILQSKNLESIVKVNELPGEIAELIRAGRAAKDPIAAGRFGERVLKRLDPLGVREDRVYLNPAKIRQAKQIVEQLSGRAIPELKDALRKVDLSSTSGEGNFIASEAKMWDGSVSARTKILDQLVRETAAMLGDSKYRPVWHFFDGPPSQELVSLLRQLGIRSVLYQ